VALPVQPVPALVLAFVPRFAVPLRFFFRQGFSQTKPFFGSPRARAEFRITSENLIVKTQLAKLTAKIRSG
jgi:hypothetical protein